MIAGIGFAIYAVVLTSPYAWNEGEIERVVLGAAAAMLIFSAIVPTRGTRLAALEVALLAALGRALSFVFISRPPDLDSRRQVAGAVVWLLVALLLDVITLMSELPCPHLRRSRARETR